MAATDQTHSSNNALAPREPSTHGPTDFAPVNASAKLKALHRRVAATEAFTAAERADYFTTAGCKPE